MVYKNMNLNNWKYACRTRTNAVYPMFDGDITYDDYMNQLQNSVENSNKAIKH